MAAVRSCQKLLLGPKEPIPAAPGWTQLAKAQPCRDGIILLINRERRGEAGAEGLRRARQGQGALHPTGNQK